MPRSSAADAALTAQRILDSAEGLFAGRGYGAVSLDGVAAEAGVTRGAVYHHYGNKKGLFQAVAAAMHMKIADAVDREARRAGVDPRVQLRAGSHAFLEAITSAHAVQVLLIDAPAVDWEEWRRLDAEHSGSLLRQVLREVGVVPEDIEAVAVQLSGAMNEAALWVAHHQDSQAALEQAHAVLDLMLDAALTSTA